LCDIGGPKSRKLQLWESTGTGKILAGTNDWKPVDETKIGKERAGVRIWNLKFSQRWTHKVGKSGRISRVSEDTDIYSIEVEVQVESHA